MSPCRCCQEGPEHKQKKSESRVPSGHKSKTAPCPSEELICRVVAVTVTALTLGAIRLILIDDFPSDFGWEKKTLVRKLDSPY